MPAHDADAEAADDARRAREPPAAGQGLDRWIPVIRPHLSEILVDAPALERLRPIARYLPPDALAVLELPLAPGTAAVADLSVRLADPKQARSRAAELALPHQQAFLHRWSQQPPELAPVSSVWLEFDLRRDPAELPAPILCVKLREGFEPSWLVEELFPTLHGRPLTTAQRSLLRRCLRELPPSLRVLYAFSLHPRPGDAIRLELYSRDLPAMIRYLARVGPPGAAERVEDLVRLVEDADRFHLSFDVTTEIKSRIGLECGFERQPQREPRWAKLFDRLVAGGLCDPDKRDAVLRWPGYDSLWTAVDRWPEESVRDGGYCVRGVSHVKSAAFHDPDLKIKGYLVFQSLQKRILEQHLHQ